MVIAPGSLALPWDRPIVNAQLDALSAFRRIRHPSATESGIPPSKSGTYSTTIYAVMERYSAAARLSCDIISAK